MKIKKCQPSYTIHGNENVQQKGAIVLHWQNHMTEKPIYYREVDRMSMGCVRVGCRFIFRQIQYHVISVCLRGMGWIRRRFFDKVK